MSTDFNFQSLASLASGISILIHYSPLLNLPSVHNLTLSLSFNLKFFFVLSCEHLVDFDISFSVSECFEIKKRTNN